MLPKRTLLIYCFLLITIVSIGQLKPVTNTTSTSTSTKTTTAKPTTTNTYTKPTTTTKSPRVNTSQSTSNKYTSTDNNSKASLVFTKQDSLDAINELLADLSLLYDSIPSKGYSYGSINVGVGKGYFTPRSSNLTQQPVDRFYYSTSGNYTHKSGFGISVKSLVMPEDGSLNLFQTMISPSYDYLRSKKWAFGVSYTHYFIKDSLSFETSPLLNEYYAYVSYKKSFLRPTLGVNYATGSIVDTEPATPTTPSITANTTVSDIALIGSIQHYWYKKRILGLKDQLTYGPTLMAVAGTSKYGTNLSIGSLGKAVKSYNSNNNGNGNAYGQTKKKKKNNGNGNGNGGNGSGGSGSGSTPPTTTQYQTNTDFALQGFTLILGANYSIKRFYLQPQLLFDYTIPPASKKFNTLFNATLGLNF